MLVSYIRFFWCNLVKLKFYKSKMWFNVGINDIISKRICFFDRLNVLLLIKTLNHIQANVPILYPLKRPENLWFSGVFRGYKIRTLARNGFKQRIWNLFPADKHMFKVTNTQLMPSILSWKYSKLSIMTP